MKLSKPTMLIFMYIQLIFYCSGQASQCKATSISYSGIHGESYAKLPFVVLDVCNPGQWNGSFLSQKFESDSQNNLYERRWTRSDCLGDPYYEEVVNNTLDLANFFFVDDYNIGSELFDVDCKYAIVRAYQTITSLICGDGSYWEQAWATNECVSANNGTDSCQFLCVSGINYDDIYLECYKGESCEGERRILQLVASDMLLCRNQTNHLKHDVYEIQCDESIVCQMNSENGEIQCAPPTTTTTTMPITSQCKATSVEWWIVFGFTGHGNMPFLALDVCNPGQWNGSFVSQKFECDSQNNLYERRWTGSDCLGDPYYEEILYGELEASLIGPDQFNIVVSPQIDYSRTVDGSECLGTLGCDYAMVRTFEGCGDDYWEQAWIMNECVTANDGINSCLLSCNKFSNDSYIGFKCYKGARCEGEEYDGPGPLNYMIVSDTMPCSMNHITNKRYLYEIQCDANNGNNTRYKAMTTDAPIPRPTTTIPVSNNSNHFRDHSSSNQTEQSDTWMIVSIVFIVLFGIVIIGVVIILLVQKRNPKKSGYTKTNVADTEQI